MGGGACPGGKPRPIIGRARAWAVARAARAGGVLTLCRGASERGLGLLVSWCHGANVAAPQCTHLREGAEAMSGIEIASRELALARAAQANTPPLVGADDAVVAGHDGETRALEQVLTEPEVTTSVGTTPKHDEDTADSGAGTAPRAVDASGPAHEESAAKATVDGDGTTVVHDEDMVESGFGATPLAVDAVRSVMQPSGSSRPKSGKPSPSSGGAPKQPPPVYEVPPPSFHQALRGGGQQRHSGGARGGRHVVLLSGRAGRSLRGAGGSLAVGEGSTGER